MPLAGGMLGAAAAGAFGAADCYAAVFLLTLIGANMIREAFGPEEQGGGEDSPMTMFFLALATSVDAMAAGVSLSMTAPGGIVPAAVLIGLTTGLLSAAGAGLGRLFGSRLRRGAGIAGGLMLIGLGLRMLRDHLGGSG